MKLEAWGNGISPKEFEKTTMKDLLEINGLRDIQKKHSERIAEISKSYSEMINFG